MTGALATLLLTLVVYGAAMAATSLLVCAAWPWLARRLPQAAPRRRGRAALGLAVAPTIAPALVVALTLLPGVAALLGLGSDHCTRHPDHPHLCVVHHMAVATPALLGAGTLVLGVLVLGAARQLRGLAAAARPVARILRAPYRTLEPGIREIDSDRPFSMTAGWWHPEVLVSAALERALTGRQLEAVLAHERAHRRRRDPLRRSLAGLLSAPLPGRFRRDILATLELASEQACDESAARAVGDRLLVAEALLAVARLAQAGQPFAPPDAPVTGFANGAVEARVRGLLGPPRPETDRAALGGAAFAVVLALLGADALHHAVEHLLQIVVHGH